MNEREREQRKPREERPRWVGARSFVAGRGRALTVATSPPRQALDSELRRARETRNYEMEKQNERWTDGQTESEK